MRSGIAAACAALAAGGCAQILGLDDTNRRDASGPGVCDVPLDCTGAATRAICGQLVDAVTEQPFAAAGATGALCQPGATEGPCSFAIAGADGASEDELFTTLDTGVPATVVDDCGRFRIEGLTGEKLAVSATPTSPTPTERKTVRAILYNLTQPLVGDIDVPIVAMTRIQSWETDSATLIPEAILLYFRNQDAPVAAVEAKIETSVVPLPPGSPFALYFSGGPYESVVDTTSGALQLKSSANGTGLIVPADTNAFRLGGARTGSNCDEVVGTHLVPGALLWIDLVSC